jgi:ABC-type uncharacterized transport system substrate-binding protein
MTRRAFITLLGGVAAWPVTARGQAAAKVRRIGVLLGSSDPNDPVAQRRVRLFETGLQELGWVVGRNIDILYRWASGDTDRSRAYAKELIGMHLDLIVAATNTAMAALHREVPSLPIVFVMVSDPVGMGYVESFSRPGRNVTGFTPFEPSLGTKWLSLLKEIAPGVEHVGLLFNQEPGNNADSFAKPIEVAALSLGIKSIVRPQSDSKEIEPIIQAVGRAGNGGLIFLPDALTSAQRHRVVELVARSRVPAIYPLRLFSEVGGLMSYGIDVDRLFVQSASYVDRILRGTNARELPVQAPTKFEFVINLKSAKALGLTVPDKLLTAADEVIE